MLPTRLSLLRDESEDDERNRTRFSIEEKNYAMASRIIADTIEAGLIKPYDPTSTSKKYAKYVPFWA